VGRSLRWPRLGVCALILVAVVYQYADNVGRPEFSGLYFFSFFTILANLIAATALAAAALDRRRRHDGLRGAATLYLLLTAIVFAVLIAGDGGPSLLDSWVGWVLHRIVPAYMLLDWLLDPAVVAVRVALGWLVFPLGFLAYSLARGPIVDWYPYAFLDPRAPDGSYAAVAVTALVMAALVAIAALALARVGALRRRA